MHEASIAARIIQIAESELSQRNIQAPVERITIRAGKLNAIIADSLTFHFDVQKKDKPQFHETELVVKENPLRAKCDGCGKESQLEAPIFVCEGCGGTLMPEGGTELMVESVSVKD